MMIRWIQLLVDLPPLVSILWKITVILGFGWILHFCLGRCNPRWRVLLWRAVVVGLLLIPILVPLEYLQIPVAAAFPRTPPESNPLALESSDSYPMVSVPDLAPRNRSTADSPFSVSTWAGKNLWIIILFAWGIIAVLITARFLVTFARIRKRITYSLPSPKHLIRILIENFAR